ncbi:MAG: hypothetical protein IJX16_04845 [Clostridia bacterium]|nr:hypothetical protein [Clostridia bacterium]
MNEINEIQNLADDFFSFLADCSTNEDFKNVMLSDVEADETEIAIEFLADYPAMSDDFE